jgi:DNA-binding MarR family transcriptional regulator
LRKYYSAKKEVEAPQAVTQKGIADAIDIRVTHVPRSVRKLDDEGLIYENVMHINGMDKRRKAYFLTEKGMFSANEIKRNLETRKFPFRDLEGNVKNVNLSEIGDLSGTRLDVLDLIKLVDKEGILSQRSIELLSEDASSSYDEGERKIFDFPHRVPVISDFIGRKKEIGILRSFLDDENIVLISINGEKGIGKSTFLSEMLSYFKNKISVFWFVYGKGDEFSEMKYFLSEFFIKHNRGELKSAIRGKGNGIAELIKGTISSIAGTNSILVFDSFDLADSQSKRFISLLSQDLKAISGSKIIILHEKQAKQYLKSSIGSEHFIELKLKGLDKPSCKAILGQKKLGKDEFERIFKLTEGNPLALKLIKSENVKDLEKSGKYSPDELTLIRYLKSIDKI